MICAYKCGIATRYNTFVEMLCLLVLRLVFPFVMCVLDPFVMCVLEQNINKQPLTDVLQELRRSLDFFRTSGKFSIATMNRGGEKEYFLCCGCEEIYIPPTANLTLKGFMVAGKHEHHPFISLVAAMPL